MFIFAIVSLFDEKIIVRRFQNDQRHHLFFEIVDGHQPDAESLASADCAWRFD
jgi:hypothetical protein